LLMEFSAVLNDVNANTLHISCKKVAFVNQKQINLEVISYIINNHINTRYISRLEDTIQKSIKPRGK